MTTYNPTQQGNSRVFIIEGRARADHEPDYKGCMMAGGPSQDFGDVEDIECPSPDSYNQWDTIGVVQGAQGTATLPLTGRYALDVASDLLRLARLRCANDVQVHLGTCTDPSDFNEFTKSLIFEDARLTNWSADDLGALNSDDNTVVNESTDISARTMYEVLQLIVAERGGDTVVNPLEDVVICSKPECGDCDDEDPGCNIIFAVGDATPGSPGTAPDLVWSDDAGVNVYADDIHTLDASEDADALACVKDWVVVVSNADAGIHYKLKATILAGTAGSWTRNTTGINASGPPNDIWSVGNFAFIVGDGGYIYSVTDPANGVTVLDAAEATTNNLLAVHALDKNFAVAVGASNTIVRTTDGSTFEAVTGPAGGAGDSIGCVWMVDRKTWWIGNDAGELYYTLDEGDNWTQFTNLPVTFTDIEDIAFSTRSVGYMCGQISGPAGVILRTYDGGYSWTALPEGVGSLPANDEIRAVAACVNDANFVVGVGLADDASDGVFLVGND